MVEEKFKDIRCKICRRRLIDVDSATTIGFIEIKCKRCKTLNSVFVLKNKTFPVDDSFPQIWEKQLKKEVEDNIISMIDK